MIVGSLAASVWLLATGQAGTVDGLFLLLTGLVIAFAFALYVVFLIRRVRDSLAAPTAAAKPAADKEKPALVTAEKTAES